jgi:hypothetical protein
MAGVIPVQSGALVCSWLARSSSMVATLGHGLNMAQWSAVRCSSSPIAMSAPQSSSSRTVGASPVCVA